MTGRAIWQLIGLAILLATPGCTQRSQPNQSTAENSSPAWLNDNSAEAAPDIDDLKSRVADLEQRLSTAEIGLRRAQLQADEAHDLAEEADEAARKACKPYGYQYGCGNGP